MPNKDNFSFIRKTVKITLFFFSFVFLLLFLFKGHAVLKCLNPVIENNKFEDFPVPSEWTLIQSTVHQRHMDRFVIKLIK
jgi:hypothetical protein